jgi:hypothetical protein
VSASFTAADGASESSERESAVSGTSSSRNSASISASVSDDIARLLIRCIGELRVESVVVVIRDGSGISRI